ncbi:MAG: helix-turn-helix domain-containing protein, partial [Mesorhizobium sp.]|nr:helix-turn-helix domain-containing protein [Mesorhizobium sp.]
MPDDAHDRDRVGALEKGLGVMEILAAHPDGMTLTEMADAAGLTRAGARRFLLTLVGAGYALQDGRTFRLSPRLLSIARAWIGGA